MLRVCIALLVCAACAADSTSPGRVFDACEPLVVSTNASDAELADLDRGIAAWHAIGVVAPVRSTDAPPAVRVVFEPGPLAYYGQYDPASATFYINARLTGDARAVVIAHELGHVLGLEHVDAYASVMNAGNLVIAPNLQDGAELERLWGACAVGGPEPQQR